LLYPFYRARKREEDEKMRGEEGKKRRETVGRRDWIA
jgi:hypothetical protein